MEEKERDKNIVSIIDFIETCEPTPEMQAKWDVEGILRRAWKGSHSNVAKNALAYIRDRKVYESRKRRCIGKEEVKS